MESNLTITQFRARLKEKTKIGHPKLKLSPLAVFSLFADTSKPFYGLYDEATFSLTLNFRTNPTYYILKGSYKEVNGTLRIDYTVDPRHKWQHYYWLFVSVLGFIFFNGVLLTEHTESLSDIRLVVNLFLLFIFSFAYLNITLKRKKLERMFIKLVVR